MQKLPQKNDTTTNMPLFSKHIDHIIQTRVSNDYGLNSNVPGEINFRHCCMIFNEKNKKCFLSAVLWPESCTIQENQIFRERYKPSGIQDAKTAPICSC